MSHSALKTILTSAVSGMILTIAAQGSAQAGAFALREQSTVGLGMAFAGVAAGSANLGSMFWNPATMTKMPGWQSEWNLAGISPYAKFRAGAGSAPAYLGSSTGDLGEDAVLPSSYGSYQINDRLWIGLSTGAPYGLATKPDATFPARGYGYSTKVTSFDINPNVAYRVNDWLSVGAGIQAMYFKAKYKSYFAPAGAPALNQAFGLEGDGWGVGYTLGATITPMQGTDIGIGFRSAVNAKLDGDFNGLNIPFPFILNPALAGAAATFPTRPVKLNITLPETLTVGVRQQINERLTLSVGAEWTNWSRVGYPRVVDQTNGGLYRGLPALTLDYKDGWFFSVGGEYKINPLWTVRAGLGYEISPIEDRTRTLRLPDNDRIWTSIGASYNFNDKITFDVSYAHLFPKSTRVAMVPGNPSYSAASGPLVGKVSAHVDIVSVGLRYRWDDVAQTIPVEKAVVRKY
ncbi:aromatic hydrocarbon degradation protein [Alsobacter metallidurans]|uniref:Aromatic hydrocarbon degradation protein n=1 Tax=Alsobacter metallidurans TaxID=340221 RepID=A0A917MHP1_9HYPH|nr:outer membrane protein transport protein [Alsobacter metallidurans]GGH17986.1 aromatic hydrocarbon degradation protein [Alsobacter metallidurans]